MNIHKTWNEMKLRLGDHILDVLNNRVYDVVTVSSFIIMLLGPSFFNGKENTKMLKYMENKSVRNLFTLFFIVQNNDLSG